MIYSYETKKEGKLYGVRFRVVEYGQTVQKNLRGFKTQKAAKIAQFEYEKEAEKKIAVSKAPQEKVYTFGYVYDLYRKWAIDNLAPSSAYVYFSDAKKYLQIFADKDIKRISKRDITHWQDGLDGSYSYKYKQRLRAGLSAVFTFALNRDYVEVNPVQRVERIRNTEPKKKLDYWTKEEFDRFIEVVDDPTYKAFFTFLYTSGCRKGEAFALRWSDIHFDTQTVTIDKNITKKGETMAKQSGKDISHSTKNKKTGDIHLPAITFTLIDALPRGEFVFGCEKPLAETSVRRDFDLLIKKAEVKRIRVHDLRHSCAALIISSAPNAGIDVLYAVAAHLRDTPEQILKTYGHLFPSRYTEIMQVFNRLFD